MVSTLNEARSLSRRMQDAQREAARQAHIERLMEAQPRVAEAQADALEPVPKGGMRTIRVGMGTVTRFGV